LTLFDLSPRFVILAHRKHKKNSTPESKKQSIDQNMHKPNNFDMGIPFLPQVSQEHTYPQQSKSSMNRLSENFVPGPATVLCGRGKECTGSAGNVRFRKIVCSFLKPYSEAENKIEKSAIVSSIIAEVKHGRTDGKFCKFENGAWWEVEDSVSREKVGK
jgi:hypothetical protein